MRVGEIGGVRKMQVDTLWMLEKEEGNPRTHDSVSEVAVDGPLPRLLGVLFHTGQPVQVLAHVHPVHLVPRRVRGPVGRKLLRDNFGHEAGGNKVVVLVQLRIRVVYLAAQEDVVFVHVGIKKGPESKGLVGLVARIVGRRQVGAGPRQVGVQRAFVVEPRVGHHG